MLELLRSAAQERGQGGALSFAEFMDIALYAPGAGYYSSNRRRVGRDGESDFYTSGSGGTTFGRLVAEPTVLAGFSLIAVQTTAAIPPITV